MARGWESKSVEDQMDAAESARQTARKPTLTPEQRERQTEREGLQLSRSRTMTALQGACDARYRTLLETTMAHIDQQLARLDQVDRLDRPDEADATNPQPQQRPEPPAGS